jgi:cyclopropane fatty-acyl-phospholipid synthase-like methyltransferase
MNYNEAEAYWDRAGEMSYASAMFAHSDVEKYVNRRLWQMGIHIGKELGLNAASHILDLGCGDGALTNIMLSQHFKAIDGFDLSVPAIQRANELAPHANIRFKACDIVAMDYSQLPTYDGAYLWGILHHVKSFTPAILKNLRHIAKRVVVLEPNGNHLMRKLLERTASYKAAGEDSFRTRELEKLFAAAGYQKVIWKRLNLFPNFTPKSVFTLLQPTESFIEKTPILRSLCTVNMWGFIADEL